MSPCLPGHGLTKYPSYNNVFLTNWQFLCENVLEAYTMYSALPSLEMTKSHPHRTRLFIQLPLDADSHRRT